MRFFYILCCIVLSLSPSVVGSRTLSIQFIFRSVHFPCFRCCRSILPELASRSGGRERNKIQIFILNIKNSSYWWVGESQSSTRNIQVYIFIFPCSVHSNVFFLSFVEARPGFLMSREKYYTHAVVGRTQRQKYYEAERILLVLVDKRSIAQPSILL